MKFFLAESNDSRTGLVQEILHVDYELMVEPLGHVPSRREHQVTENDVAVVPMEIENNDIIIMSCE